MKDGVFSPAKIPFCGGKPQPGKGEKEPLPFQRKWGFFPPFFWRNSEKVYLVPWGKMQYTIQEVLCTGFLSCMTNVRR